MKSKNKIKYSIISVWVVFILGSLYFYFFDNNFLSSKFESISGSSIILGYIIFLIAGCLRGFTLIPVTYFIFAGVLLFPFWPLYMMILIGVFASSICVYYFSHYLDFDSYFEKKYPKQIEKIKDVLKRHELPIVIFWSFAPFLPTDLICYVCGTLKIDVRKFILGVMIGEGVSCLGYVFIGKQILNVIKM